VPADVVNAAGPVDLGQAGTEGKDLISDAGDGIGQVDRFQVCAALEAITVETLTPIEAMNELYKLKKMLD
jgi:hypothetical protein